MKGILSGIGVLMLCFGLAKLVLAFLQWRRERNG